MALLYSTIHSHDIIIILHHDIIVFNNTKICHYIYNDIIYCMTLYILCYDSMMYSTIHKYDIIYIFYYDSIICFDTLT